MGKTEFTAKLLQIGKSFIEISTFSISHISFGLSGSHDQDGCHAHMW